MAKRDTAMTTLFKCLFKYILQRRTKRDKSLFVSDDTMSKYLYGKKAFYEHNLCSTFSKLVKSV